MYVWVPRVGQSCIDKLLVNEIARVVRIFSPGVEVAAEHQWQRGAGGLRQELVRMRQDSGLIWDQVHGHEAQWNATNGRIDRNVAGFNLVKWRWQRDVYRFVKQLGCTPPGMISISPPARIKIASRSVR
jgi:hypothetical protein